MREGSVPRRVYGAAVPQKVFCEVIAMMNYIAIDFETATGSMNSACSVATVEVRDGQLKEGWTTLIQPPGLRFDSFNIGIHGISPKDVADAPTFAEVWEELKERLAGKIVVAHNASFDMGVLKASLLANRLQAPDFRTCCTVRIARKVWPALDDHKLNTVGAHLNINFRHHRALDDARTCAAIPLFAGMETGTDDIEELAQKIGVRIGHFGV